MKIHRRRIIITGLTIVVGGVWLAPVWLFGQAPAPAAVQEEAAKSQWETKTAWGDPDLQGTWTTWGETPLQTPNPDRRQETEEERAERIAREGPDGRGTGDGLGSGMSRIHSSPVSEKRPSLVVEPQNGRVPIIPEKIERIPIRSMGDTWLTHSAWQRCVSRGVPGRLLQGGNGGYNKGYEILQKPGYVVLHLEEIHEFRVIPVDGRPHVGPNIRMWSGDSRGRWEGKTLVVETTNFNGKGDGQAGVPQTDKLKVTERFTRLNKDQMVYSVTFDDPNVYKAPWTAMQIHNLDPEYVLFEYACHEGNTRYMENTLSQGRLRDQEEAAAKTKASR